ncbi:hypothetical protein GQ602_006018 [Ophiocordyceps camponoti-floridani]|uniref:Uncharacterized protein n=1 Tax=Ophiocordyceps camponoti-floridani TaxID=2030778 RepID=A0A8H4Q2P3_9HYPO|nr:hypothetical protein GQ602_006018 [Ophiocordyceps camponoti-floridani]
MTSQSADHELLTEHFTYPPAALLDDIINTVNVLADRALTSVESLLLSLPPRKLGFKDDSERSATAARLEIENGTHQLETLVNASIDKNFDLFELYTMRNILAIHPQDAPYIRLAHYQGLDFDDAAADAAAGGGGDRPSVESLNGLRRQLQASLRLTLALEAERAGNDALLTRLYALLGEKPPPLDDKDDSDSASDSQDDTTPESLSDSTPTPSPTSSKQRP